VANVAINGFDQGSQNNPSIFYYNNAANSWVAPSSSTGVKVTDNYGVYQLFVRGDRSIIIQNQFVAAKPTTLDPKGELFLGDVTVAMLPSGFQPVGNPYASQIKIDNVSFNGTLGKSKTIYLWDPKALGSSGVGAFITCSGDGGSPVTYTYTGNSSNYGSMPGVIESSGAFMVGATSGNIVFHETDKTITSSTIGVASRTIAGGLHTISSLGKISKLYIDLIGTRNGEPSLADGIAVTYNNHYENEIDQMDAVKLQTFSTKEMLSIKKEEKLFAIERRNSINEKDSIFLNISRLNTTTYQLLFRAVDFDDAYTAYLEDRFTNTRTPVNLKENTVTSFTITSEPASSAADRFYITFKKNKSNSTIQNNSITVFPNPVKNGKINLQMKAMPDGEYAIRLINNLGQVLYQSKIVHQNATGTEVINVSSAVAKDVYRLEIISAEKTITTASVMIQ
jgi:hypothetical protein